MRHEVSIVHREYTGNMEWKEKKRVVLSTDEKGDTTDTMIAYLIEQLVGHADAELEEVEAQQHAAGQEQEG